MDVWVPYPKKCPAEVLKAAVKVKRAEGKLEAQVVRRPLVVELV